MYCTVAEVKSSLNFPVTGAPISDEDIAYYIVDAQKEIEDIYKTKFGNVDFKSIVTSSTNSSLIDTTASWDDDEHEGKVVWVYSGTGKGQYREILSNTSTTLTISPDWETNPDNTSLYRITDLGMKTDKRDGTGTDTIFTYYQPLIDVVSINTDNIQVDVNNIYVYKNSGRIQLGKDAGASLFNNARPQTLNMTYIYGVYPIPRIIKRLCILLAGMRALIAQIAGTYDDFATMSLPGGFSGSKGEPYVNIQSSLNYMQGEARGIIFGFSGGQVSADFRSGASYRQFTYFG